MFQAPWQNVITSCEALSESHHNLSQRIATDVEKPLQDYQSKSREMNAVTTVQGNLIALAKEFDEAQKKADKLQGKKGGGSKAADQTKVALALSSVQEASQQWESQAPYIFEQLQALDEHRVHHLRDALTQLQTHEMDQLEKSRSTAEVVLNSLLNVDSADEISTFVAITSQGLPSLTSPRKASRPATSSAAGPSLDPGPPVPSTTDGTTSLAPPMSATDDHRSEVSAASGSARGTHAEKPKRSGIGGGLKRLGTVMVRRNKDKENKGAEQLGSPEKKQRPSRNPLRRKISSSQDMHQIPSPNASMTELADTSARQESSTPRVTRRLTEPPPAQQSQPVQRTPDGAGIPALPRSQTQLLNGAQQRRGSSQELSAGSPAVPPEVLSPRALLVHY